MSVRKQISRGDRNAAWIMQHCCVPEGKLVGKPVKLSKEQRKWLRMIYDTPTRMFICSLPRKNGKTSFSAMIVLLHLAGPEAVKNGQIYSAAQSREQASILHSLAAKMVRMSPDLSQYIVVRDTGKQLVCPEIGTLYRALSAEASTAYGLSPSLVIHDELGQVRGPRSELFDALETASAAQENPLSIVISTQAPTDADLLSVLIDRAMMGKDKRNKCVLYCVPEDKDPFDPKVLQAAQPNWHLMNHDVVLKMATDAKSMPSSEASFRNLIANQRINVTNPFISRAVWEACSGAPDDDAFHDFPVYIGIDLSARNDLTAMIAAAKDGDGVWHVRCAFFAPKQGVIERSYRDRVPYDVWAQQGFLTLTPGASVDYEYVARQLCDWCDEMDVAAVPFDRWRIDVLKAELTRLGRELPLVPFGQGFKDMTPALDTLGGAIADGKLRHGGNPILTMCASNAVATNDPAGNKKLDKSKATGRIDGMIGLAMAIGCGATVQSEPTKEYQMIIF